MSTYTFVAMHVDVEFLVQPFFVHGFSASCHAFFLLALSLWLCARLKHGVARSEHGTDVQCRKSSLAAVVTCSALCLFYLSLGLLNFFWYKDGRTWPRDHVFTLVDLGLRAATSLGASAYLVFGVRRPSRFPALLRIWWGFFLFLSTCVVAVDLFYLRKRAALSISASVLDIGSFLFSIVLGGICVFGNAGKERENSDAEEPLLNGGVDASNGESSIGEISLFGNAGFFSKLTFYWVGPLLALGRRKTLDLKDVPQLHERDTVNGIFPIFKSKLYSCSGSAPAGEITTFKLAKALFLSIYDQILLTAVYALVNTCAIYVGPYLIDFLVRYLNGERLFANEGYLLLAAFVGAKLLECLTQRHGNFRMQQVGIRIQAAVVSIIYQKGLTLSESSKQSRSSGEVINLVSVDADQVESCFYYMHDLWIAPLDIVLALWILYVNIGIGCLAALAATILVVLVNYPTGKLQTNNMQMLMKSKDSRMKATSEILRNMRILKLQGWEMKFLSGIIKLREEESNWLKKFVYTSAISTFLFWISPTFIAVATFGACMLMGIPLESGKVLSALATIRVLQTTLSSLPDTVTAMIQNKVSLDRIASFLCLEELQPDALSRLPSGSSNIAVEVINGSFSWDLSSETPTLRDLNFQVLQGMRVAVCGTVGSGKSSLLSCLLGEVPKISGSVSLCGTTAYVPQSPWIQSGKIVDSILFGKDMDHGKYNRVLEACSLKRDLEILQFGDQTVIGERGINLSGGQKQRIQIARALYHDADIFLFDDPFSAVDAHTGSHLFKECLLAFLASKTVIYVTHQVEFLPSADLVLFMKDGTIAQVGKYNDILNSSTEFMELVGAHKDALAAIESNDLHSDASNSNAEVGICDSKNSSPAPNNDHNEDAQNGKTDEVDSQKGQLVQEEEREKGRVGFWVYWRYMTMAYKGSPVPLILLCQILFQAFQIGSNYWMAWAAPVSKDVNPPVSGLLLIYVYVALAVGSSFCVLVRSLLLATAGYKTATLLFNKLHTSIFRAPMSFFDSTPSGRILNRVSKDQSQVDNHVFQLLSGVAFRTLEVLGTIAVMSQVSWQVFVIFFPVFAGAIWYQNYYISTARELSRLIGVQKAPIIQHFSESLSGSTIIRSFDQNSRFVVTNFYLSDSYSRPWFHTTAAMEWLGFRLDMLSTLTFAFTLIILITIPKGLINPGIAGLSVTYGLSLNALQSWLIWGICILENSIVSVERILQFSSIASEPPLSTEIIKLDPSWPLHGEIELCDIQVRYGPHMPFVLRGLTCTFRGGKKTGIVGRTGSGKSTLIQALFRIIDPTVGRIVIDGIDISMVGLHDLRSRLGIIPQDPTMFEGTIRSNVDPLEEYTDGEIWKALDSCQLGEEVRKKELKLDSGVTENGENWSVGQRQLVCLGRVILKKSKILVLDEATASVDTATDSLIQMTLRQQFSDSTVITIAHRITSVLDSDMVLLLDNGMIVEHDTPARLLENKSSLFSKLVAEYTMRSSSSFGGKEKSLILKLVSCIAAYSRI
ncbi:ABC transporter C family member 3-like [Canna indica]|uniref:ABC transporter C family member 3-like n=1 Tax=Canna indica TaxID=4628 RepID=A0AAQ3KN79_9LILI|nr:ABC transporter C family member 3-like [Canna indica]